MNAEAVVWGLFDKLFNAWDDFDQAVANATEEES